MSKRVQITLVALVFFLSGLLLAPHLPFVRAADDKKVKAPIWMHGFNVMSRKSSEFNFSDKDTKKYGIEVYKDEENGNIIYVSETGSIAVLPAK